MEAFTNNTQVLYSRVKNVIYELAEEKPTRLATNEERLMLFEEMFKYGIAFDKHDHHLIGKL